MGRSMAARRRSTEGAGPLDLLQHRAQLWRLSRDYKGLAAAVLVVRVVLQLRMMCRVVVGEDQREDATASSKDCKYPSSKLGLL